MNRNLGIMTAVLTLCAAAAIHSFAAVKTGGSIGTAVSQGSGSTGSVSAVGERRFGKVPSSANVLVIVKSNGEEKNASGTLSVYRRNGSSDSWKAEITDAAAYMGRGGMGKIKEGDQKTPCGMFAMNTPFGIKERSEGFPDNYLKLDDNYYWGGNSGRSTYNKLFDIRNASAADIEGSEHLIEADPEYNYAIDTGYNPGCAAGKGSAIFLHCKGPKVNTAGCIAVEEDIMKKILTLYEEGRTVIIIDMKDDFDKYE